MKSFLLTIVALFISCTLAFAEEPLQALAEQKLGVLLKAMENKDLDAFNSVCDEEMQEAMNAGNFQKVAENLSALLKQGYKTEYFGSLDRTSLVTHYWKIDFDADGMVDFLAEMAIGDDKVAGFLIR